MTGRTNNTNNHAQVELAVRRSRSRKMMTNANTTLVINPTTNNIVKMVPKIQNSLLNTPIQSFTKKIWPPIY